jgi:hypothetical protein
LACAWWNIWVSIILSFVLRYFFNVNGKAIVWHNPMFYIGKRCNDKQEMGEGILCYYYKCWGMVLLIFCNLRFSIWISKPHHVSGWILVRVNDDGSQKSNTRSWYINVIIKKSNTMVSINNRGFQFL